MTKAIATHPRAVVLALITAGLLLGIVAGSAMLPPRASADSDGTGAESVVTGDVIVNHQLGARSSGEQVRIWGSGFAPGQEVILLINDGPGTPSDITNYVSNKSADNTIVANAQGAWTTVWTLGRFTRQRSGIGPGDGEVERVRSLSVLDPGTLDIITSTPLAFCRVSDREAIMEEIAEMEAALALYQAVAETPIPEAPVNAVSQWERFGVPEIQAAREKQQEEVDRLTAEIDSVKEGLAVPSHCPA